MVGNDDLRCYFVAALAASFVILKQQGSVHIAYPTVALMLCSRVVFEIQWITLQLIMSNMRVIVVSSMHRYLLGTRHKL